MALGNVKKKKIYEKTDSGDKYFLSATKQTAISASYAAAEHLTDTELFEATKPLLFQMQLIEEDIEEIRRFATGSGEIDVDGGSF